MYNNKMWNGDIRVQNDFRDDKTLPNFYNSLRKRNLFANIPKKSKVNKYCRRSKCNSRSTIQISTKRM